MANDMTIQTSSFCDQKAKEDSECQENIPPASILTETGPATLSSNWNGKGKPQLSGLQSTLTPVLKYLNIGNKSISSNNGTAKSNASVSVLALGDKDNTACSVLNENLPEISFLNVTCDSPINMTINSTPSTPAFTKVLKKPGQALNLNLNSIKLCPTLTPIRWLHDEILPEITLLDDTCDSTVHQTRLGSAHSDSAPSTPTCELLPETSEIKLSSTLTPKTDTSSVMPDKRTPSLETTHDCTPKKRPSSETSEIMLSKKPKLELCSEEKMQTTLTGNLTHSINSSSGVSDSKIEDEKKIHLTLDGSKTSSENITQNMDKTQSTVESIPVNMTQDLSSSSNMSVRCDGSQSFESITKNVTSELQVVKESCPEGTGPDTDIITCINQSTARSLNSTFTTVQEQGSVPVCAPALHNRTLDLPKSNSDSHPMTEVRKANMSGKVSPETSFVLSDKCSDSKSSQSCEMQDENSLHKTSGSTLLVQAGTTVTSLQNTFEKNPNGTINSKEMTNTSDKPQDTRNKTCHNVTTETLPDMSVKILTTRDLQVKPDESPKSTFNVNPAIKENSGASGNSGEAKDSLNNGHPLSESIIHHNTLTESHKANVFSLDNTFDFKLDSLITSTPMPTGKVFNFTVEREEGKTTAAQKKLYGDVPNKPDVQAVSEMPSNIVCDRKTFLPHPAPKQNLLSMKPPSLLSKFKPASLLPKRPDLLTSGLPMTRQAEALKNTAAVLQQTTEISSSYNLRSTAAVAAQKPPSTGIQKPPPSSIPSGIQRPGHGLKPPMAKTSASVSSSSGKPPGGPNALVKSHQPRKKHPKTEVLSAAKKKKIDQQSGHVEVPVSVMDTARKTKILKDSQRSLPAKIPKHDTAVPSTSSEISTGEQSSRVRTLKFPTTGLKAPNTKPLDCTNCSSLQEQLKLKDEEIKRLKEELLKCSKKEDPTFL